MSVAPWVTDAAKAMPAARRRTGKTRGAATTAPRVSIVRRSLAHAAGFVAMSAVFYGFLALLGHSLHSSALKVRENADLRAEGARADALELGRQVSALSSVDAVDRWARAHGFVKVRSAQAGGNVTVSFRKDE